MPVDLVREGDRYLLNTVEVAATTASSLGDGIDTEAISATYEHGVSA